MKKVIMFLAGTVLLLMTCAVLFFSGALYDAGDQRQIEAFVMQPNDLSTDRIGRPIPIDQMSETSVRERLIRKFVHEYFYVNPDVENIAGRTRGNSIMAALAAPAAFDSWKKVQAEEIKVLAENKSMRVVTIADEILKRGDYWEVFYELRTWERPNEMDTPPLVESGTLYLKITLWEPNESRMRETWGGDPFNAQKYLNGGGDPAAIFKFRVDEVRK